jgi:hypothetical protein
MIQGWGGWRRVLGRETSGEHREIVETHSVISGTKFCVVTAWSLPLSTVPPPGQWEQHPSRQINTLTHPKENAPAWEPKAQFSTRLPAFLSSSAMSCSPPRLKAVGKNT